MLFFQSTECFLDDIIFFNGNASSCFYLQPQSTYNPGQANYVDHCHRRYLLHLPGNHYLSFALMALLMLSSRSQKVHIIFLYWHLKID